MKRILTTLSQKWPEYLIEVLVIAIGILTAFGLNNWNQERRDNIRSQAYLVVLADELDLNTRELSRYLIRVETMLADTYKYLEIVTSDNPVGDSLVAQLTAKIGPVYIQEINSTAINDLVQSGSLEMLDDQELKRELLIIPRKYENFMNISNRARLQWDELFIPYYQLNADLLNMWDSIGNYPMPKPIQRPNLEAFYQNQEFSNMMVGRMNQLENIRRRVAYMIEDLEATNARIKARLK